MTKNLDWMDKLEEAKAKEMIKPKRLILLAISGQRRLGDIKMGKKRVYSFPKALDDEIAELCTGSIAAKYTYLVKLGLATLKERGELIVVDVDDI